MEKKDVMKWTRAELLNLPVRRWDDVKSYHGVMLVPTYKLHDSGWRLIAIVGLDEHFNPVEIAAYCDDVQWRTIKTDWGVNCDMIPKTNILRFHSNNLMFEVGVCLSTTEIKIHGHAICYK